MANRRGLERCHEDWGGARGVQCRRSWAKRVVHGGEMFGKPGSFATRKEEREAVATGLGKVRLC